MLTVGMTLNGYEILAAVQQFRGEFGKEGVVILGQLETKGAATNYVVATVPQDEADADRPARHWSSGNYTYDGDRALRRFVYAAGLPKD